MSQRNNENKNQSCLNSTKISTNSNHQQTFDLNRHRVRQISAPVQLNNYSNLCYNQIHERRGDEINVTNASTSKF
jgi:hypothetical protein